MKKSQAFMEFLMTYGWAILVVLVAIGSLAYFGVLSPEKFKVTPRVNENTTRCASLICDELDLEFRRLSSYDWVYTVSCYSENQYPFLDTVFISYEISKDFNMTSCEEIS